MKNNHTCPLCQKGELKQVAGNSIGWAIFRVIVFRPIRIIVVIIGAVNKKYKCSLCGKKFEKNDIDSFIIEENQGKTNKNETLKKQITKKIN